MEARKSTRIAGTATLVAGIALILTNSFIVLYRTFVNTVIEPDYVSHAALIAIGAAIFVLGHKLSKSFMRLNTPSPKA